jgi:hypothetical protein
MEQYHKEYPVHFTHGQKTIEIPEDEYKRLRETEREFRQLKEFEKFYKDHVLQAFIPYEDDPTFQAYGKSEVDEVLKGLDKKYNALRAKFYRALAIAHDLAAAILYSKAGGLFTPGDTIDRRYARKLKAHRVCFRKALELEGKRT